MSREYRRLGAKVNAWLADPLPANVRDRILRIADREDVRQVAVMPDVHLSAEYCVGTAVATRSWIIPHAIGGDIGCGMAAMRLDTQADRLIHTGNADQLIRMLQRFVPTNRHPRETAPDRLPVELQQTELSHPGLEKLKTREGRVQLGTLGRGNHFLEFQADQDNWLWLMLHSGSRAMGQAITAHHLDRSLVDQRLPYFIDTSPEGQEYLHDVAWATTYARENRLTMLYTTAELLKLSWNVSMVEDSLIESNHNHVRREVHSGESLWVHRKGTQSAATGEVGILPGSMATASYHVAGRGCQEALCSSSHGAGRRFSRAEARSRISLKEVRRQMGKVFFDERKLRYIREEAPTAYKNIRQVIKAQRELVRTIRELKPVLNYKGV